jgi:hypothetical protein
MATIPGMEFMDWSKLNSISDTLANPQKSIGAKALGAIINKFAGSQNENPMGVAPPVQDMQTTAPLGIAPPSMSPVQNTTPPVQNTVPTFPINQPVQQEVLPSYSRFLFKPS